MTGGYPIGQHRFGGPPLIYMFFPVGGTGRNLFIKFCVMLLISHDEKVLSSISLPLQKMLKGKRDILRADEKSDSMTQSKGRNNWIKAQEFK